MQHQFDQLKEEMVAKEAALAREAADQIKLIKEKEELAAELEKAREDTVSTKEKCRELEKNLSLVSDRQRATQAELDKSRSQLEQSHRERGLVDARLSRKAEENEALRKQVQVQEKVLARGEAKYQERMEDIR